MNNLNSRIALGTVQFGLDYGIKNPNGQVHPSEVSNILSHAGASGITTIDTAFAYGVSEVVLGEILGKNKDLDFEIISKFPKCNDSEKLMEYISTTLDNLKRKNIYGYLAHDTDSVINNPGLWDVLSKAKENGSFRKIGISVYHPSQVEWFFKNNINVDIIQFPYNIFDNRFEYLFDEIRNRKAEIHVRSVFLQGLLFLNPENLPKHFNSIKNSLLKLRSISEKNYIPLNSLLLGYVLLNLKIDKVVLGVDSLQNLKDNLDASDMAEKVSNIMGLLKEFSIDDENILLPFNWKK